MTEPAPTPSPQASGADHVHNQPVDPPDANSFSSDAVLVGLVRHAGASWAEPALCAVGELVGSAELEALARSANKHTPVLHTHDRFGRRVDRVEYHPAYHELMRSSYASKVHSLAWTTSRPGAHVARAALSYLWNQCENGIGCPATMSYAIVPLLRANPQVGHQWEEGILSAEYDPRHLAAESKTGLTVAMSMTEKQGGSDLRSNATCATAIRDGSDEYLLSGHKFFCSAPMGDAILLTARTDAGVSLFLAPRILPDGGHNGIRLQRLKDKVGNRSNASAEIEIDGTVARRLGAAGHGIREFISHMTHYIRMDMGVASAGLMRRALTLAYFHVRHRTAFGGRIADLPQMRNVLADLALEWEAALLLSMRMATALDEGDESLFRIGVPITKYWNCRRANHVVLEALECHGGMGYVEEQPIGRMLREAPLNSIWEGGAAMMGLDVVRALRGDGRIREALLQEIRAGASGERSLTALADALDAEIAGGADLEPDARRLMGMAATGLQASLMRRFAPAEIADLFVATRLSGGSTAEFGTLPNMPSTLARVAERAVAD